MGILMPKYANQEDVVSYANPEDVIIEPKKQTNKQNESFKQPQFIKDYINPVVELLSGQKIDGKAVTLEQFPSHVMDSVKNALMFSGLSPIKLGATVGLSSLGSKVLDKQKKISLNDVTDSVSEGALTGLLSKFLPAMGREGAKAIGKIGGYLSGIEAKSPGLYQEALKRAMNGEKVFGRSDELGKQKDVVFQALKDLGQNEPMAKSAPIIDNMKKILDRSSSSSGVTDIDMPDVSFVHRMAEGIKNRDIPVTELDKLKNQLQNRVQYNRLDGKTKSEVFLNDIARVYDDKLGKLSPKLQKANKDFAFAKNADDLFKSWKPQITPYHGTAIGIGAGLGSKIAGIPLMTAIEALAPIFIGSIPAVNKGFIKGAGQVSKVYKKLPNGLIPELISRGIINGEDQ